MSRERSYARTRVADSPQRASRVVHNARDVEHVHVHVVTRGESSVKIH